MNFVGLNSLKLEGSKFETGYGYSKFVTLKLNGEELIPILSAVLNTWGVEKPTDRVKEKIFCNITEEKNNLHLSAKTSNVTCPRWVCGYPCIRLGESIWGPFCGFELGQVKNYDKMSVSAKWGFKINGSGNFSFDMWLTKDPKGLLTKDSVEIMIWLDYKNFDVNWEYLGRLGKYKVKYFRKPADWDAGGHVFVFISDDETKTVDVDILSAIKFCKKSIVDIEDYWIRSIDLGTELMNNTEIDTKIFKLDFNFENKKVKKK